jgi:chitinase
MSYDIYGTWDAIIPSIGPFVYADTNLTGIDQGLQLLWHNGIDPAEVNMGIGFYGRGIFQMLS